MGKNEWGKCKFCMHPRAKLKHVLWLGPGDLKDSLKNAAEKSIHNMSSTVGFLVLVSFHRKTITIVPQKGFLKLFQKISSNFPEKEMIRNG